MIFFQDVKSRSVHWVLFPVLTGLLLLLHYFDTNGSLLSWQSVIFNIAFFVGQIVLVTAYFSVKNRKLTNITNELLGIGDVLFILSITCYLSIFNFLFFYIASLVIVLIVWLAWQMVSANKSKHIPLAGLQAILFAAFLICSWSLKTLTLTDDIWILNLIGR